MNYQKHLLATALALSAGHALAVPFAPIDARSMSMGGVGVANARAASAGLFNPAMLAAQPETADFSIILPTVGVVLDDKDDVVNTIDDLQADNGSLTRTSDAVDAFNANPVGPGNVAAVGAAAAALATDLPTLGGKPVNIDVGAGFSFGVPSKKIGVGLHVNANVSAGVVANVSGADVGLLQTVAGYAADGTFSAGECADPTFFDPGCQLKPLDTILTSSISVVGVSIAEAGLSFAREFTFGEQTLSLGITPKLLQVETIHYSQVINSDDEIGDVLDDAQYRKEYSDFNFDLGAAKVFGEEAQALTVGLVIKNLISQSYDTAPDATGKTYAISIEPQVRAGVAKRWGRRSVAADLDITKNQSVGLGEDSQFLSVGAEYDLRYLQLRAGYRHNLVSDGIQDMATVGLGLGPVAVSALYADENSLGVNVQLGFSF